MRDADPPLRIDLTVLGPDGRSRDVAVLARAGTPWADVAPLLPGLGAPVGLPARARVGYDGPRAGATVGAGAGAGQPDGHSAHSLDVVGGPDAGRSRPLGRTPVTVGRGAGCDLVLRDPAVSRRHVRVGLTSDGGLVHDCGSAGGSTVESIPVGTAPVPVPFGAQVRVGDSFLRVTTPGGEPAASTQAGSDGGVLVHRAPPPTPVADPAEIGLPDRPAPAAGQRVPWLAATLPAVLAGVLALAMHAPGFLLFTLLTPLTLLGSGLADRLHRRRDVRRSRRAYQAALRAARDQVAAALAAEAGRRRADRPDPVTVARTATRPGARLWCRDRHDPRAVTVRLGLGDLPAGTRVRDSGGARPAGSLPAVPVTVDLAAGPLGIVGPPPVTRAVARWVLAQLAVALGPDDLRIGLLLSASAEPHWRWARWLPHLNGPPTIVAGPAAEPATASGPTPNRTEPGAAPWRALIVDACGTGTALPNGSAVIALATTPSALPVGCTAVATVCGDTGGRLALTGVTGRPVSLVADQVSVDWCDAVARALAPLRAAAASTVPVLPPCTLADLLELGDPSPEALLAGWRREDSSLGTPLGVSAGGTVWLDLVRDGPHALVAGTTGSGKSELLRSLIAGLAARHPPDEVGFVLVDYKGGAAFAECARLPHTLGLVTDLDAHLAGRALASLECELRRRERLFAAAGAREYAGYRAARRRTGAAALPRMVIAVDEFAELAAELGEFVTGLVGIARRGRSLGIHLVLATQRPAGVLSPEIRANTAVRIALRVADAADSRDVIGGPDAARLDRSRPGLAYLHVAGGPPVLLQTARAGGPARTAGAAPQVLELDAWRRPLTSLPAAEATGSGLGELVDSVVAAGRRGAYPAGRRGPWLPPLPSSVTVDELPSPGPGRIAIGLVDQPREQRQLPLTIDLGGGSMLLAGGPRSGRTTALLTLARSAASRLGPDRLHLHGLDFAAGGLAGLAGLPHLGSLLTDDIGAAERLLARLAGDIARRRADGAGTAPAGRPALLLVLDGWERFLAAAEQRDAPEVVDALLGLLRTGPSAGLTVVVAGDRGVLTPRLAAAVRTKLVLPLTDRADYALAGIGPNSVPTDPPPGRAVRAEDGVEVQLAHLGCAPTTDPRAALGSGSTPGARTGSPPIRVRSLPAAVRLDALTGLRTAGHVPDGSARAPVLLGVGGDAAGPLAVDLHSGRRRLLIAGSPGSGRSSALLTVFRQLTARGTPTLVAAPDHSPLAAAARSRGLAVIGPDGEPPPAPDGTGPTVLLVDDCERFRDGVAGDRLTAWAAAPGEMVVVAAGGADELAVAFRGVAAELRRARCGLLLRPGPGDGEVFGIRTPRRRADEPPGRGVLVGDPAWGPAYSGGPVPIQVAQP